MKCTYCGNDIDRYFDLTIFMRGKVWEIKLCNECVGKENVGEILDWSLNSANYEVKMR